MDQINDYLVNIYLFVEDIKEYIPLNTIKINIQEESGFYICSNKSIDINCEFINEDNFKQALHSLKYYKLIYEYNRTFDYTKGRCYINKKDILSDVILYIEQKNSGNLLKILELKNVIITSLNEFEKNISLTCDYYLMFDGIDEIKDDKYLADIYRKVYINSNKVCHNPYLGFNLPFNNVQYNKDEEDYEEIYDDWDDYDYNYDLDDYEEDKNNNNVDNIFEKSSKLVSKIFSSFYK